MLSWIWFFHDLLSLLQISWSIFFFLRLILRGIVCCCIFIIGCLFFNLFLVTFFRLLVASSSFSSIFPLLNCIALHSSFGLGMVSLGSELDGFSTEICLEICPICLSKFSMEASWFFVVNSWFFIIFSMSISRLVIL